jgi:hypothetical protein
VNSSVALAGKSPSSGVFSSDVPQADNCTIIFVLPGYGNAFSHDKGSAAGLLARYDISNKEPP